MRLFLLSGGAMAERVRRADWLAGFGGFGLKLRVGRHGGEGPAQTARRSGGMPASPTAHSRAAAPPWLAAAKYYTKSARAFACRAHDLLGGSQ